MQPSKISLRLSQEVFEMHFREFLSLQLYTQTLNPNVLGAKHNGIVGLVEEGQTTPFG
jgi:hypothetical protein